VHEGEKQFAIDLSNASQAKGFSAAILARELDQKVCAEIEAVNER